MNLAPKIKIEVMKEKRRRTYLIRIQNHNIIILIFYKRKKNFSLEKMNLINLDFKIPIFLNCHNFNNGNSSNKYSNLNLNNRNNNNNYYNINNK